MSHELLIQELTTAKSSEQKAAIVAEAVIQDLPSKVAKVAIKCSFLPWFSTEVLKGLLSLENAEGPLESILDLPFIENTSSGYCFHEATRRGLLQKYKTNNPSEITLAFQQVQKVFDTILDTSTQSLILTLYGYVLTNQGLRAEELFYSIMQEGKIPNVEILSILDEAEEFCIFDGSGLTPSYWFYRANIFLLQENFEAAIRCSDKALSLNKNYYRAYSIRSYAQARLGDIDGAFHDINIAIQLQPDEFLYRSRASLYILRRDYKNAVFDFTRAIRHNPTDVLAYAGRANVYLMSQKEEKAFRDLDTALELSTDPQIEVMVYTFYARALVISRDFEKALVYLDKVLELEPSTGSYRRKGDMLFKLKRFEEATECYEQSLELDSENQYSYLGKGRLYLRAGDYERAVLDFKRALSIVSTPNPIPLNTLDIKEANLRLWEAYLKLGNNDEAEKQKKTLLNTKKETELYEILYFCRKYQLFATMLEAARKLIDTHDVLRASYLPAGYALNQLGDYESAIMYFQREEKEAPNEINNTINLGLSYWGLGNYERAMYYFEQANKELNKKPKNRNFSSLQKSSEIHFSSRVFLKVMLGNLESALQTIDKYLQSKDFDIDEFYDLRDWGIIVKRTSQSLLKGFDEFYDHISKILSDIDGEAIYQLTNGI